MTRLELIRLGPYRFFFPLGILCGILGVGHWIFWSVGWLPEANPFFHASIQVQGFLTCFVVGFLMTALPRFSGTGTATLAEVAVAGALASSCAGLTLRGRYAAAQVCFLALIGSVILFAKKRFSHRVKNPPSSFVLILFGMVHAVMGSSLILYSGFGEHSQALMEIGRQMLQIGFLLCLVLGIAGYLAPFLMGYASDPSCDPGATPLRESGWLGLGFHVVTGLAILGSFFAEIWFPRTSAGVLAGAVLAHMIFFARIFRPVRKKTTTARFFWLACWMVPVGLFFVFAQPDYRIAGLHILFIGGFSLMIFSFGLFVALSHGARADLLNGPLIPLRIVGVAVLAAMALRVAADIEGWHYRALIHAASGTWVLAALFWIVYVFPKLWAISAFDGFPSHKKSSPP